MKQSNKRAGKPPHRNLLQQLDLLNRFRYWYMGGISITRSIFRVRAAWQGILIILSIFCVLFIMAAFYTDSGEFVISLDSKMSKDGFYLSETPDFTEHRVCVRGKAVVCANNISIMDIAPDVAEVDGEHNGMNYVAQTFYLTNRTGETKDYQYSLMIRTATKGAEEAVWIMVYHNGKQTIYAMNGADGEPEGQYALFGFPFEEDAADAAQYQLATLQEADIAEEDYIYQSERVDVENAHKLVTTPFLSDKVICQGVRPGLEDKEADKYTVVIWYEGEDPECVDDIIGGQVELYMNFYY